MHYTGSNISMIMYDKLEEMAKESVMTNSVILSCNFSMWKIVKRAAPYAEIHNQDIQNMKQTA